MDAKPTSMGSGTPTQALAASLIRQLGFDEAIRVCRSTHWDGVLRAIRPRGAPTHPARREPAAG